jgi:SAM-dependent methyltransferase
MAQRPGILLDIGSGPPYQGHISTADIGPQTKHYCLDISAQARPHVIADVENLPIVSASVDHVLCDAVLEHVRNPQLAADEIHRVLKNRGHVMASVPFIYPYHDQVDYYRFTDTAIRHIFREFSDISVVPLGDYFYAVVLILIGFNFRLLRWLTPFLMVLRSVLGAFLSLYDHRARSEDKRRYLRSFLRSPIGWYVCCKKETNNPI